MFTLINSGEKLMSILFFSFFWDRKKKKRLWRAGMLAYIQRERQRVTF